MLNLNKCVPFHTESNNSSSMSPNVLWHRRLGHVQEIMKRVVQGGIFSSIHNSFGSRIECIRGN